MIKGRKNGYRRISASSARKHFENGGELYLMCIGNDDMSFGKHRCYSMGCLSKCGWCIVSSFNDMVDDFSKWLGMIGCESDKQHNFSFYIN